MVHSPADLQLYRKILRTSRIGDTVYFLESCAGNAYANGPVISGSLIEICHDNWQNSEIKAEKLSRIFCRVQILVPLEAQVSIEEAKRYWKKYNDYLIRNKLVTNFEEYYFNNVQNTIRFISLPNIRQTLAEILQLRLVGLNGEHADTARRLGELNSAIAETEIVLKTMSGPVLDIDD